MLPTSSRVIYAWLGQGRPSTLTLRRNPNDYLISYISNISGGESVIFFSTEPFPPTSEFGMTIIILVRVLGAARPVDDNYELDGDNRIEPNYGCHEASKY